MKKHNELTLYHQDKCFSWSALEQQLASFFCPQSTQVVAVSAQNRLFTTLALLYGFKQFKTIFPLASDYSVTQRQNLISSMNSVWLDETDIDTRKSIVHEQIDAIEPEGKDNELALAVATSGSQAAAKIALISRHNIISHSHHFNQAIPLQPDSLWLNCMPMHHIAGIIILYRCWFNNASMLLHDEFDEKKVWHDLHSYPVTHISLVPRMLGRLLQHSQGTPPPKQLRYVIVGGDKLSDVLYQRARAAGWPIMISYGMTETTSTIAIGHSPDALDLLPGFEARVSDTGILQLKSAMLISAYAESDSGITSNHWYETHDRVLLNQACLTILGRNDRMIISGGKNIAPESIEEKLLCLPFVDDIAVASIPHPDWGCSIVAVVCGNIAVLKQWLNDRDDRSSLPHYLVEAIRIPRNDLGKVNRVKLQELIHDAELIRAKATGH